MACGDGIEKRVLALMKWGKKKRPAFKKSGPYRDGREIYLARGLYQAGVPFRLEFI